MDVAQVFRGGFPFAVLRRFAWFLLLTIGGVFLGTKALVAELKNTPVKVGFLSPGIVTTEMLIPPPDQRGERWDLHLKGGGPTRFARGGDGLGLLAVDEEECQIMKSVTAGQPEPIRAVVAGLERAVNDAPASGSDT